MADSLHDPSLDELLLRVGAGDRRAFDLFYARSVDRCLALACGVLGNRGWAEDCVADTYVLAWRQAAGFDPARASAVGWLLMICRTRAIDRLRRERTQAGYADWAEASDAAPAQGQDPAQAFGGLLAVGRLRTALHRLSPEQRRALELTYFKDLSNAEIAQATGWPLGTVKSLIRRAIAVLRKELLDDEPDREPA